MELTAEQLRMVVKVSLLHLTESERLFVLLCQLTGIRLRTEEGGREMGFVTKEGQNFRLQDYEIVDFCERLRWLIDTVPDIIPNPSKRDDYLRDMSFGDWFEADTQFRLYEDDMTWLILPSSCRSWGLTPPCPPQEGELTKPKPLC